MECEISNISMPDDAGIKDIFSMCKSIAIIGLSPDPTKDSHKVARYLQEKGFKIGQAEQTISAMLASERISDYLAIKRNEAVLRLKQISYFCVGQPFEYVRTQYVGSRFEFYLEKNN